MAADAKKYDGIGVARYCQVSSGRRLNKREVAQIAENIKSIVKESNLKPCVSLGLIDREDLELLKEAGLQRVHNNIESSPEFFGNLCSTHTTDDKIKVMKRNAYGFRDDRYFTLRLYALHDCRITRNVG